LFDEYGHVTDRLVGDPIQVGFIDLRLDDYAVPGITEGKGSQAYEWNGVDPIPFSVVVSNWGNAPVGAYAVFALDGGGEYTCGVELYSEPARRVGADGQGVELPALWDEPRPGRHIVTILVKDLAGTTVLEKRGVPFQIKQVAGTPVEPGPARQPAVEP
jgi:hypothetical protein